MDRPRFCRLKITVVMSDGEPCHCPIFDAHGMELSQVGIDIEMPWEDLLDRGYVYLSTSYLEPYIGALKGLVKEASIAAKPEVKDED